jgi:hypothetical protein
MLLYIAVHYAVHLYCEVLLTQVHNLQRDSCTAEATAGSSSTPAALTSASYLTLACSCGMRCKSTAEQHVRVRYSTVQLQDLWLNQPQHSWL